MDVFRSDVDNLNTPFYRRTADILVLAYARGMDFGGIYPIYVNPLREMGSFYRSESR